MAFSRAKRWQVQYPVQLFTEDLFIEGRTVDMSLHGLSIATGRSIREGTHVFVRVLAPEGGCSVDCVLYTVRWADNGKIGLEAREISAKEQRRLQDRLTSLDQDQEPAVESTSPCITIEQPIASITDTVAVLWHLFFPSHEVISASSSNLHSLQGSKQ